MNYLQRNILNYHRKIEIELRFYYKEDRKNYIILSSFCELGFDILNIFLKFFN
jgi:hypothetical protein